MGKSRVGSWNWILLHFGRQDCPSPATLPIPMERLFPFVVAPLPSFTYVLGPLGREEEQEWSSIFCPFVELSSRQCSTSFFLLLVSLLLPHFLPLPYPSSSFLLPADVADLLSHAPCRQLARWTGASGAVNRAALLCRFVRVPYFCVLIEVTHKKRLPPQMIAPSIPLDPETCPMHPPYAPPIN